STQRFQMVRAAPYIAPENGAVWRTLEQLDQLLAEYQSKQLLFYPRKWCEENLNDITLAETIVKEMMYPSDFRIFQKTRSFAHMMQ
ncbi:MAG: hypothetical protein K2X66_14960, partial [Cyanobacteria bacterium]|nr:hypothetical protein [Cyanobacteriota bacterium]